MTLGHEGAFAYADERSFWGKRRLEHPGFSVDTTGAGDAFVAGTLLGIVEGMTLERSLDVANAMAALSTTTEGEMDDPPSCDRVDVFLQTLSQR